MSVVKDVDLKAMSTSIFLNDDDEWWLSNAEFMHYFEIYGTRLGVKNSEEAILCYVS